MSKTITGNTGLALINNTPAGSYDPVWDYDNAIRVSSSTPSLAKLSNILAPLDAQNDIKIAVTPIANIYTTLGKGKIPVSKQDANVAGTSTFVEVTASLNVAYTEGGINYAIRTPIRGRLEIACANDTEISEAAFGSILQMLLASLADIDGESRISEIQRGCIVPKGL